MLEVQPGKILSTALDEIGSKTLQHHRTWTENAMAEHVNARDNQVDRRTMIVGPGLAFTGEIACCDRLIVEGSIDASLPKCQHVIIAETGLSTGMHPLTMPMCMAGSRVNWSSANGC